MLTGFNSIVVILCVRLVAGHDDESLDEKADWKTVMKTLKELEHTVNTQNARISFLEKRNTMPELEALIHLEDTVNRQREHISILEKEYQDLHAIVTTQAKESVAQTKLSHDCFYLLRKQNICERRYSGLKKRLAKANFHKDAKDPMEKFDSESDVKRTTDNLIRKGRLLTPPETTAVSVNNVVAFYAYLSASIPVPSAHHILTFDTAVTNAGNAYHPNTGIFIAPRSGLYVFTWTVRMYGHSHHITELLVNKNVVGVLYFDPNNEVSGSVSGTVVVHVNQGDDVFVRTGERNNAGDITSDVGGRSSFSGWALIQY